MTIIVVNFIHVNLFFLDGFRPISQVFVISRVRQHDRAQTILADGRYNSVDDCARARDVNSFTFIEFYPYYMYNIKEELFL